MATTSTTTTPPTLMTAADLLRMPEYEKRYELVRGVLRVSEPAGWVHGMIAARLVSYLLQHVEPHGLGRVFSEGTGFFLARDPDSVRSPDAAFVREERMAQQQSLAGFFGTAPDLAVEVISPSDRIAEVEEKMAEYWASGVRSVWTVYPNTRTVTVHSPDGTARTLKEGDVLDGGDVVPGFRCNVAALFEGVPKESR